MDQEVAPARAEQAPAPGGPAPKRALRIRVAAGVGLAVLGMLGWWLYSRQYEETDDAQVDGNVSSVSARVPGTVTAVPVVDNQEVKAGEVLVELDPADLEVAAVQAKAAFALAEAQLAAEHPNVPITVSANRAALETADADVESARSDVEAARRDLDQAVANDRLAQLQLGRGKELLAGQSIAQADQDQRVATAAVAAAAVAAAQRRLEGKQARLESAVAHQQEVRQNAPRQLVAREASVNVRSANLEVASAQLHQAQLNLGYARVLAPADGIIGRKSVNVGDRVQPGQQLFALTQTGDLWVTANFRETQVEHMRIGQPAVVHVDALSRDFTGKVESFAGATGSRYSLLPPENATGNYVKVVQRIPVRIRLDPGQPEVEGFAPGCRWSPR